jgi:hypothetical protein
MDPECKIKCRQKQCPNQDCRLCTKKGCPRGCKCISVQESNVVDGERIGKWIPVVRKGIDVPLVPLTLSAKEMSHDTIHKIQRNIVPKTILSDLEARLVDLKKVNSVLGIQSSHVPAQSKRYHSKLADLTNEEISRLVYYLRRSQEEICRKLLPNDHEALISRASQGNPNEWIKICTEWTEIARGLPACPEQNAILAMICSEQSRANLPMVNKQAFAKSRRNARILRGGNTIPTRATLYSRYNPDFVKRAVYFILNPKNVTTVSWKNLELLWMDGGLPIKVSIPAVLRKKNIANLYRHFVEEEYTSSNATVDSDSNIKCIGLTLFRRIAETITDEDQEQRQCIDYVTGLLIHDSTELMRKIITTIHSMDNKHLAEKAQARIQGFIAIYYSKHRLVCPYTTEYSLKGTVDSEPATSIHCDECQKLFTLFDIIDHVLVLERNPNTHLLKDVKEKFKLYLGHKVRTLNQRKRIEEIMQSMSDDEAMIVIDYKMKFNPLYWRETTLQHYGKRGIYLLKRDFVAWCYDLRS